LVARAGPKLTPRDVPVVRRRGSAIITRRTAASTPTSLTDNGIDDMDPSLDGVRDKPRPEGEPAGAGGRAD